MGGPDSSKHKGLQLGKHTADMIKTALNVRSLAGIKLHYANLYGSDLQGEDLQGTDLSFTNLRGANLMSAKLQTVDFLDADLRKAKLQKANLSKAKNLTARMLAQAIVDETTILPRDISLDDVIQARKSRNPDSPSRRTSERPSTSPERRSGKERREKERDPFEI